jgi:pilus assembly protein Flp/PilA
MAHRLCGAVTDTEGVHMLKLIAKFQSKMQGEEGATAVEYGLMVALIAGAIIVTVGLLGGALNTAFTNVLNAITAV